MAVTFPMKKIIKQGMYLLEAFGALCFMTILRVLPLDAASALGGNIAGVIGPWLKAHRTARRNLQRIMPELSDAEHARILKGMWNNLGRTVGEFPHVDTAPMRRRVTIEGGEHIAYIRDNGGGICAGGHFANWDMLPLIGQIYQLQIANIFRQMNNPYARKVVHLFRSREYLATLKEKGNGAREIVRALQAGKCVGVLVDQKFNEGDLIPFMGVPARTTLSATKMAIRFEKPLLVFQVVRTHGVHFHVTVNPLRYEKNASPELVMQQVHVLFERWIRERPEQWFWVHNRWGG